MSESKFAMWLKSTQVGRILYYISPAGWASELGDKLMTVFFSNKQLDELKRKRIKGGLSWVVWLIGVALVAFLSIKIYRKIQK